MNNDDFTEAAHAEAERLVGPYAACGPMSQGYHDGHAAGVEWARDYLAAQEPTDAEVLAAMTAYEGHPDRVSAWRAALSAARAARRDEEKRDG